MDRRTYRIGSEGIEKEAGAAGDQRRSGEVYGEMGAKGRRRKEDSDEKGRR